MSENNLSQEIDDERTEILIKQPLLNNNNRNNHNQTSTKTKYIALALIVLQNASLVLCMRYAKTRSGPQFTNSTAVVMCELTKLLTCLLLVFFETNKSITAWANHLYNFIVTNFYDTLKVAFPAFIYVVQNNLLYVSVENLPAATFQVSYQTKILTTAMFSITMLGKDLSKRQWLALIFLFIGVAIVQLNNGNSVEKKAETEQNQFLGFGSVLLACFSSGFAGVYFERILKGSKVSLWTRNIQLGLFGFFLGLITALSKDGDKIFSKGWFYGYDKLTWLIITNQAMGGLLVAFVIKYADNILKGFATSVSIIVSAVFAYFLFDFEITVMFCVGTALVTYAVFLYNLPNLQKAGTA